MSDLAYYRPLKNINGQQLAFAKFQFFWEPSGDEQQIHYFWIYKEDEQQMPQMFKYGQCVDNKITVNFQYSSLSMVEIQKIRFLIFASDVPVAPSGKEIAMMSQQSEFICAVCCGTGNIQWNWVQDKLGMALKIVSDKKIPEGFLYFEYTYGMKSFQYEIPGFIQCGENYYGNILFPELAMEPQLKSRVNNLNLQKAGKKAPPERKGGGIIDKIAQVFR